MIVTSVWATLLIFLASCSSSNFRASEKVNQTEEAPIEVIQNANADADAGLPVIIEEPTVDLPVLEGEPDTELSVALLSYGQTDKPIDYLFVLDNSSSMDSIVPLVNSGFASIVNDEIFPRNSKVAVMTTMIADPNDFTVLHVELREYNGMEFEPGFLDFVDQTSIVNFRDNVSNRAGDYTIDGCNDKWFKPTDTNDDGIPCITAATQSAFSPLRVEAGITAYEQLILKNKDEPIFRDGALLNVIYVTDTHDPGANEQELVDNRKNYAQLDELTKLYNKVESLKFHAMAPATECSENFDDTSYYTLVNDSKGEVADSCIADDYSVFLKNMVAASVTEEPVFKLTKPAIEVTKVLVEGEEISDYTVSEDGLSIRIEGLDPGKRVGIIIEYL